MGDGDKKIASAKDAAARARAAAEVVEDIKVETRDDIRKGRAIAILKVAVIEAVSAEAVAASAEVKVVSAIVNRDATSAAKGRARASREIDEARNSAIEAYADAIKLSIEVIAMSNEEAVDGLLAKDEGKIETQEGENEKIIGIRERLEKTVLDAVAKTALLMAEKPGLREEDSAQLRSIAEQAMLTVVGDKASFQDKVGQLGTLLEAVSEAAPILDAIKAGLSPKDKVYLHGMFNSGVEIPITANRAAEVAEAEVAALVKSAPKLPSPALPAVVVAYRSVREMDAAVKSIDKDICGISEALSATEELLKKDGIAAFAAAVATVGADRAARAAEAISDRNAAVNKAKAAIEIVAADIERTDRTDSTGVWEVAVKAAAKAKAAIADALKAEPVMPAHVPSLAVKSHAAMVVEARAAHSETDVGVIR